MTQFPQNHDLGTGLDELTMSSEDSSSYNPGGTTTAPGGDSTGISPTPLTADETDLWAAAPPVTSSSSHRGPSGGGAGYFSNGAHHPDVVPHASTATVGREGGASSGIATHLAGIHVDIPATGGQQRHVVASAAMAQQGDADASSPRGILKLRRGGFGDEEGGGAAAGRVSFGKDTVIMITPRGHAVDTQQSTLDSLASPTQGGEAEGTQVHHDPTVKGPMIALGAPPPTSKVWEVENPVPIGLPGTKQPPWALPPPAAAPSVIPSAPPPASSVDSVEALPALQPSSMGFMTATSQAAAFLSDDLPPPLPLLGNSFPTSSDSTQLVCGSTSNAAGAPLPPSSAEHQPESNQLSAASTGTPTPNSDIFRQYLTTTTAIMSAVSDTKPFVPLGGPEPSQQQQQQGSDSLFAAAPAAAAAADVVSPSFTAGGFVSPLPMHCTSSGQRQNDSNSSSNYSLPPFHQPTPNDNTSPLHFCQPPPPGQGSASETQVGGSFQGVAGESEEAQFDDSTIGATDNASQTAATTTLLSSEDHHALKSSSSSSSTLMQEGSREDSGLDVTVISASTSTLDLVQHHHNGGSIKPALGVGMGGAAELRGTTADRRPEHHSPQLKAGVSPRKRVRIPTPPVTTGDVVGIDEQKPEGDDNSPTVPRHQPTTNRTLFPNEERLVTPPQEVAEASLEGDETPAKMMLPPPSTEAVCVFCGLAAGATSPGKSDTSRRLGALLPLTQDDGTPLSSSSSPSHPATTIWYHLLCAVWSPEVTTDDASQDGSKLLHIPAAVERASGIKCARCRRPGASLGCVETSCQRSYHYPCAVALAAPPDPSPKATSPTSGGGATPTPLKMYKKKFYIRCPKCQARALPTS